MKIKENNFLQTSTILFVLNITASALNYLCQLIMARVLSVESYGTINTIFSFMMIVAVPGTTLTMVVSKFYASEEIEKRSGYFWKQFKVVCILTIVVFLFLVMMRKQLTNILSISDNYVLVLAFALAAFGFFQPLYVGVFSGTKKFILVGLYSLFIPIYKLLAIMFARYNSNADKKRLYIVLVIIVIGTVLTALYGHIKSNNIIGKSENTSRYTDKLYSRDDFNTFILNISLMLYMNIDLLAVRYYGDETESGLYSSVLLFGRIIYYFATTLGTILLPSVAEKGISTKDRKQALNKASFMMVTFAIICMVPINIWKKNFINLLYGSEYIAAGKYVIYVSIIALSLSIYTIIVNYVVGIGKTKGVTIIMLILDAILVASVLLIKNVMSVLLVIGIIGILGSMSIYLCLNRTVK